MKFLRPRSADSGLVTVLLVSDAELAMLEAALGVTLLGKPRDDENWLAFRKLKAELETARKAL